MTSSQPYLLRAIYEWIMDNGMTPQLVANATVKGVEVPQKYIENGKIVLNIHPSAVRELELGNQSISCSARFGGAPFRIFIPVGAVVAIYSGENGKGLFFNENEDVQDNAGKSSKKNSGPHLTIIK